MKKILSFFMCIIVLACYFTVNANAVNVEETYPVIEFVLTSYEAEGLESNQTRATGLIASYALEISKSGTTLKIIGKTLCAPDVVKCGFKNLTVERRLNSSSSWEDYYEFGNIYLDEASVVLNTSLIVESGYQYRVTTKHYAKKSLLVTQNISNESNIIQF